MLSNLMLKGFVWSSIERLSVQTVQFLLGIVIARILLPSEYGTIGLLTVFIAFLSILIDSGFTKALIQKQNRSQTDLSTIFFFNIAISVFCYIVLWFVAPIIANFYKIPSLVSLTRVLGISILLNAFFAIPLVILTIDFDFKSIAKINLIAVLFSGIAGVIFAYKGFGVWALVVQTLVRSFLTTIFMWFQIKWKPFLVFSTESFKTMFSFGSRFVLSSLLAMIVNNISALFIAKLTTTKELGYYTRGTQFADVIYSTFNSVIGSVLLPGLSTIQNEREKLVSLTRTVIKSTAIMTTPILIGMAVIAKPLIRFLLTDKWLPAVPIMQLICIARLITVIASININLLYALGRTDLTLKQDYLKIIVRLTFLGISFKYGIIYIALAELLSTIVHFFINCYSSGKILKYGAYKQIYDLLPVIGICLLMAISMYFSMIFIKKDIIQILIGATTGLTVYIFSMYLFNIREFISLINKGKSLVKR